MKAKFFLWKFCIDFFLVLILWTEGRLGKLIQVKIICGSSRNSVFERLILFMNETNLSNLEINWKLPLNPKNIGIIY